MKIILSFLFTTILLYTLIGQCTVEGSISSENIACNDCVTLSANGFGENTSAFTENFNSGQPVGWDFTQTVTISTSTCGIPSLDGSQFMWMGNSSPAPRTMATVGLDVSSGGNVCFEMRYAIQEDPSPCEGPDLGDEGVTLQYSINNGASWNTINYWPPLNGGAPSSMTVWNQYCENIPVAAQTTNTMFRWTQLEATSEIYDHWGMDNVEITIIAIDDKNDRREISVKIDPKQILEDKQILKQAKKTNSNISVDDSGNVNVIKNNEDGSINQTTSKILNLNNNSDIVDIIKSKKADQLYTLKPNIVESELVINLPSELSESFKTSKLVLKDGSEMPDWIKFDPITGKILADPPDDVLKLDLKLIIEKDGDIIVKDLLIEFSGDNNDQTNNLNYDFNHNKFVSLNDQLVIEDTNWDDYGVNVINRL